MAARLDGCSARWLTEGHTCLHPHPPTGPNPYPRLKLYLHSARMILSDVLNCTVPPLRVESSLLNNPIPPNVNFETPVSRMLIV
jgi:hypothetical protein